MRYLMIFTLILFTFGCAQKRPTTDYALLIQSDYNKSVSYICDYSGASLENGQNCPTPENADYVSYFIPPSPISPTQFKEYMAQTIKMLRLENNPSLIYFTQNTPNAPHTSSVILSENGEYVITFTSTDLLAKSLIFPVLYPNIHTYLPSYRLISIEIISNSDGQGQTLKTFDENAIASVLISLNADEKLKFEGILKNEETITIRYTHIAMPPTNVILGLGASDDPKVKQIYSEIGARLQTYINIEQFYRK